MTLLETMKAERTKLMKAFETYKADPAINSRIAELRTELTKLYGPKGPTMTWAQRDKAGVDAKHFQAALAEKGKA